MAASKSAPNQMVAIWLAVLASSAMMAQADHVGYKVEGRFLNITGLRPSEIKVVLNSGQYSTFLRHDQSFTIYDVAPGTHWLEVVCTKYSFDPVVVHVSAQHAGKVKATLFDDLERTLPYPLILKPLRAADYFEHREPFSILSYLKNPMVLMFGFTIIMSVVMPRMVKNMDPEELQKMAEIQADMSKKGGLTGALKASLSGERSGNDDRRERRDRDKSE